MEEKNLIVFCDGSLTVIPKVVNEKGESLLDTAYLSIYTDMVQIVPFGIEEYRKRNYIMLVDEEGKLKNRRENKLATKLSAFEGDTIVGNVVICKMGEEDFEYLSDEDVFFLTDDIWERNQHDDFH